MILIGKIAGGAPTERHRRLLAVGGGLLLTGAFPDFSVAGFAWIAPAWILFAALGSSKPFGIGYLAGLAHFTTSLYWLLLIPFRFWGIPVGPLLGWAALSAFMSLFFALWVWFCWKIYRCAAAQQTAGTVVGLIDGFLGPGWGRRAVWALSCAAAWVGLEMIRARILTGFPWNFVGASQHEMLPLIQIASITGVYGVSFLCVWFSIALGGTLLMLARRPAPRLAWLREIALPLLVVVGVVAFGFSRLSVRLPERGQLQVALVQPSVPQTLIWDPDGDDERFARLMDLSESAVAGKPDLLVWPEAALPGLTEEYFDAMTRLMISNGVWMVFGADDFVAKAEAGAEVYDVFNSAFLFNPEGDYVAVYRKARLVAFGEYIPLIRWFPFLKFLTPVEGGFSRGEGPVQFEMSEPRVKFAVLICFEDVFPHYTPGYADDDTDFLLNLTNDGWFAESAAQRQHAATALLRAVENGLPLVRSTNNGLTCWIDERGRLRDFLGKAGGDIYGVGYLIAEIPLPAGNRPPTFYRVYGDVFGWLCLVWGIVLGARRGVRGRR